MKEIFGIMLDVKTVFLNGLFALALYLCSEPALAQSPSYYKISTEQGLPDNKVYHIYQDRTGLIWLGTEAGLFRYNGVEFISYKNSKQDARALTGMDESAFSGRIYCFNFKKQLFYVEGDSLNYLGEVDGYISSICTGLDGNLYVAAKSGLHVYNEKSGTWLKQIYNEENPATQSARLAPDSSFWFVHDEKVVQNRNGKSITYDLPNLDEAVARGEASLCLGNKDVWLFFSFGAQVFRLQNNQFVPYSSPTLSSLLKDKKVTYVKYIGKETIWISSFSGQIILNTRTGIAQEWFTDFAVSSLISDREHNLWFSTLNDGLLCVPDSGLRVWSSKSDRPGPEKISKLSLLKGWVFYITEQGKYGKINAKNETFMQYSLNEKIDLQSLYADTSSGNIYFSGNNKLLKLGDDGLFTYPNSYPPIKCLLKTNNGFLLGTSWGSYITDHTLKVTGSINEDWARALQIDKKKDCYWLATNSGLYNYTIIQNREAKQNHVYFPDTQVVSIAVHASSPSLFGLCFDGTLFSVEADYSRKVYGKLPSDMYPKKLLIANQQLYMATNKGIVVFNYINRTWFVINKYNGLLTDGVEDIAADAHSLWAGTSAGIQKIPLNYKQETVLPKVFLNSIETNGIRQAVSGKLTLAYGRSFILFPEAMAFRSRQNFRFAYRLLPHDPNWHYFPSNIKSISVPPPPPGKFMLELKVLDYAGRNSENTIQIQGLVKAPFWQQAWFILLCLFALGTCFYFIFQIRIKQLKKKQERELNRLRLENELNRQQQAALKAQMNPHFIFNVLNSIKTYIYENDKKNAAHYLSRFSDLVRKVLTHSNESYISINEELELIENYIQLEAMLLEGDFQFHLNVDESIDRHMVKIPSMVLQPLVENAFKHGLRHREGKKELWLHIQSEPGNVKITLTDNGIGRKASGAINGENKQSNHHSFASDAIMKRIHLLNTEGRQKVSIDTKDLEDEYGLPTGTSITINIKQND